MIHANARARSRRGGFWFRDQSSPKVFVGIDSCAAIPACWKKYIPGVPDPVKLCPKQFVFFGRRTFPIVLCLMLENRWGKLGDSQRFRQNVVLSRRGINSSQPQVIRLVTPE